MARRGQLALLAWGLAACSEPGPVTAPSTITYVARIAEDRSGQLAQTGEFGFSDLERYPPSLDTRQVLLGYSRRSVQALGIPEPGQEVRPLEDPCDPELPRPEWAVRVPGDGGAAVELSLDGAPKLTADWLPPRCEVGFLCVRGACEPRVVGVGAGEHHACAHTPDGALFCWGRNELGAVGPQGDSFVTEAVQVEGLGRVAQVAGGSFHTCARLMNGTVWCWGAGGAGQLGDGTTEDRRAPVRVLDVEDARDLAVGAQHACAAVGADGRVICWGANGSGQLGQADTEPYRSAVWVSRLDGVVAVSAGDRFSCALEHGGKITCWGEGAGGELGPEGGPAPSRAVVAQEGATQLSSGRFHSCARFTNGAVLCWGQNTRGQLGGGVPPLPGPALEVRARGRWSCARLEDQTVHCWGSNQYAQRGSIDLVPFSYDVPLALTLAPPAAALSLGERFGCMLDDELRVRCWGWNGYGQLGSGQSEFVPTPDDAFVIDAVGAAAGDAHTCLLGGDGRVTCFGANYFAELGRTVRSPWLGPGEVQDLDRAVQIGAGRSHTCARRDDGTVSCWGYNAFAQIDAESPAIERPPQDVGIEQARDLAVGGDFACAATGSQGEVRCWGINDQGQLGRDTGGAPAGPGLVPGLSGVLEVAAGRNRACARRDDATVWCWGDSGAPAPWMQEVAEVRLGRFFGCARRTDGAVLCWGLNDHGQLGDGTRAPRDAPSVVPGLTDVASLRLGSAHACAVKTSGELWCWGDDDWHQLGDGDREDSLVPARVRGVRDVRAVALGQTFTVAVTDPGLVKVWGWNAVGQLGVTPNGVGQPASLVLGLP